MKAFEKVVIVIGFLVVVGAVVAIRLKMPELGTPEKPDGGTEQGRVIPVRPPVRPGGPPSRPERPERPLTRPGGERPTGESVNRQDTILARVNRVPITEWQVFGPSGLRDDMMEHGEGEYPKRMLDQAIDQELLRQYARGQGLDQTDEYAKMKKQQEDMAKRMEVNRLAGYYESTNEELVSMRESLTATAAEVDAYYEDHSERYKRLGEDRAKKSIERMLSMQKYQQGYNEWLAGVIESVPMTVNGQEIPLDVLREEMRTMAPGRAVPGARGSGGALVGYIRTQVDATDDSDESLQRMLDAEIKVGSSTIGLNGLFPGAAMMRPSGGPDGTRPNIPLEAVMRGPMLITALKGYIVAEKAMQEGMHETEAFKAQAHPGPAMNMGRDVLPRMVMEKEGLLSPGDLVSEVTQAEIEAHIADNPGRYERIMQRSPERADGIARRRIAYEKLREKKEDFVKDLRADAVIEIVDERFM